MIAIVGQEIEIPVRFRNKQLQKSDPDEVYFSVERPGEAATVYRYGVDEEIERTDEGEYVTRIVLDTPGTWSWSWYSVAFGSAVDGVIRARARRV